MPRTCAPSPGRSAIQTYNIYGISYGTKLALETMRGAPEGIRSVVIDGVAPSWLRLYDIAGPQAQRTD